MYIVKIKTSLGAIEKSNCESFEDAVKLCKYQFDTFGYVGSENLSSCGTFHIKHESTGQISVPHFDKIETALKPTSPEKLKFDNQSVFPDETPGDPPIEQPSVPDDDQSDPNSNTSESLSDKESNDDGQPDDSDLDPLAPETPVV